ncbi:MAG TPA: S41 family peptidase [Pyrinomonadaceae bacterium]|nr:S41 family peptidase [Pyrinomonadaceae bacterium]
MTARIIITTLLLSLVSAASAQSHHDIKVGYQAQLDRRIALTANSPIRSTTPLGTMTPQQRRQAVDAVWGAGPPTAEKLRIFDKFWSYVDAKFAAFQNIDIDWRAMRDRYRPEIAAGVSHGRFTGIMNHIAIELREGHTHAHDIPINWESIPLPGVPVFGVGDWTYNPSGACSTAQPDGSALVYSAMQGHPLGLRPGDRVLGYDGRPWREIYQELLAEELPLWPLFWGSSPSAFQHTMESSATINWHLFQTMDVRKRTGETVHVPTSLMTGARWWGFCSEQLSVPGIPKPVDPWEDGVRHGVITGTDVGYIYVWGWGPTSSDEFADAIYDLTQVRHVEGLIVDFRFNSGGIMTASHSGISNLFDHPVPTTGFDERLRTSDHFAMKNLISPSTFILDFRSDTRQRGFFSYDGPIALLLGPGAVSSGDFASLWMTYHPRVRTFGKPTSSAFNLPTQPALGTELDLGPDWFARVAEGNMYRVGSPNAYLTHTDINIDEPVWLTPEDVTLGRDTVVAAARQWIDTQTP